MFKVGVTGGIGSGKTIVCGVFEQLDVPVYSADSAAKNLITSDKNVTIKIKKLFGSKIYSKNGDLYTRKLAEIVFNDKKSLQKLNSIIHPAVKLHFSDWLKDNTQSSYIIKEAAILFESDSYKDLDAVIIVVAPIELKIKRVMERDGVSREAVMQRMKNQMSDQQKISISDYVIYNDGTRLLLPQILEIHDDLLQKSNI
ncbi:MAG: dephospho-CoA kinase [Bacteroidota bacterium]